MTQKEFETLKEGDEVVLQKSGDLNGQKAVVVRMETGMYLVFGYQKLKKA